MLGKLNYYTFLIGLHCINKCSSFLVSHSGIIEPRDFTKHIDALLNRILWGNSFMIAKVRKEIEANYYDWSYFTPTFSIEKRNALTASNTEKSYFFINFA